LNDVGSTRLWEHNANVARFEMCRLICRLDISIFFAKSFSFEEYIKKTHNPRFSIASRQTIIRDIKMYYNSARAKLVDTFKTIVSSVVVSLLHIIYDLGMLKKII
jgi:hypothetical protein